jgi:hypothetical protein
MITKFFSKLVQPSQIVRCAFSGKGKLEMPVPPQPTVSDAFAKKFSPKEVEKILDPMGFIDKKELSQYEGLSEEGKVKELKQELVDKEEKTFNYTSPNIKEHVKTMEKEYGFKVKGPEPSRYGDWEKKGRVSDF